MAARRGKTTSKPTAQEGKPYDQQQRRMKAQRLLAAR
jgi:hypothetical protein